MAAGGALDRPVLQLQRCPPGWMGLCLPVLWKEEAEEEAAVGGSGVCNRIRGCVGDSCGRGLRRGLGQVEKAWAWGLCSFIIWEAALLGRGDLHPSVCPESLVLRHSPSGCCLVCGEGCTEAPAAEEGRRVEREAGLGVQPCLWLVVWAWANLTSVSFSSPVKWRHHMKLS